MGLVQCFFNSKREGVIAYASQTLWGAEKNMEKYSSMKLELLGIKWAITEKFRDYLIGSKFVVFTDNNPLAHLRSAKLGATEQRWVGALSSFDFDVKYKPGVANKVADGLSRRPHLPDGNTDGSQTCCEMVGVTRLPDDLKHTTAESNAQSAWGNIDDSSTQAPFPNYTHNQLQLFQQRDAAISRLRYYWEQGRKPDAEQRASEQEDVILLLRQMDKVREKDGLLYRVCEEGRHWQLLLPQVLVGDVLKACHDQAGHQAVKRTTSLVRSRCYWPRMTNHVTEWCAQCDRCTKAKNPPKIH
ncbi:uncharacterized protein [Diadema setosum]|uniref:uncharacterized protein n=1 Tax=Diadema setosum TaxID=31175 RepID=UPI003B3AD1EA